MAGKVFLIAITLLTYTYEAVAANEIWLIEGFESALRNPEKHRKPA